jgi:hypothetical protein
VGKGALVKVLGRGELTRKVTVKAHAFSASAERPSPPPAVRSRTLPAPVGRKRRPPAKGNAVTPTADHRPGTRAELGSV